ncbi:LuxR C-terminal-related transcriptional regulator [Streptomyces flavofungini]|uniref:LuxR C-terminal-related transcriptional regulator n=1 Tax=Streptomyces flavofungini TaxID=68200 RepID=UPI0034DF9E55
MTKLPPRELEVLKLVAGGFTHKEIGERLGITHKGVTATFNRALLRLGALNAPHAVHLAVQEGILPGRARRRPGPARQPLTERQALVLVAAADGASLTAVAARLGTTRQQIASSLSGAYIRLGVHGLPRGEKRAAAVAEARRRGLIPPAEQERAA